MAGPSLIPRASIGPGGKEELRAAILKTYLLRVRDEKGERKVRALLQAADIEPGTVDNETGWVSTLAAKRVLKGIAELLGEDALRHRGAWVTHPEALGTYVRMLRVAKEPVDAYRYIVPNTREVTRIGDWELEELTPKETKFVSKVRLTYRIRSDADDAGNLKDEILLCAARQGELASFPQIWGLPEATIRHDSCLAKGADHCVYEVEWATPKAGVAPLLAAGAAVVFGGSIAAFGSPVAAGISGALGAGLGYAVGVFWHRSELGALERTFEKNRIAALERGLELKGEASSVVGELVGTVLGGKYKIGRKIGSGGIGAVYAAEHVTLGHEVAIKVLRGAAARDGSEIARLRREAYIQVHIEHPNIARVLDLDQMPDGSIYVVMERLHGRSLAERLGRNGTLAPGEAIKIFSDVCDALTAAHERDVVHRDLKPGNIFLCQDGRSKVLDFGMSKLSSAESLTQEGFTLGTPEYMAPEQCIGADVVAESDLYSLGVVMYEALAGELPITATNRRDLLDLHQRKIPMSLREKRSDLPIPAELDEAVMMCLKKRIAERPHSANALKAMLESVPKDGLVMNYPASSNLRRKAADPLVLPETDAKAPTDPPKKIGEGA